ncbi:MAG: hypothetical protein U5J82_02705 [Desulfobacterales bacterium]|nr:hypothetical protein [Desulfobacterales bacterium]
MVIDVVVVVFVVAILIRDAFFFSRRSLRSLRRAFLQVLEPQKSSEIVEHGFQGLGATDDIRIFYSKFFGSLDNSFDIRDIFGVVLPQGEILVKNTDDDVLDGSLDCVDAVQFFLVNPASGRHVWLPGSDGGCSWEGVGFISNFANFSKNKVKNK